MRIWFPRRRFGVILSTGAILALTSSVFRPLPALADTISVTSPGPLSVTQSAQSPAVVSVPLVITVTGTNTTNQPASNVSLEFFEPVAINRLEALTPGAVCHKLGGGLTFCNVASLSPGTSLVVQLTITPAIAGTLDSTAEVSGGIGGISSFTTVDLVLPVNPAPTDVQITGSASTGSPTAGSSFTYTFQVKNNGPQPAPGVAFTDALPAALTFAGVTSSQGTCAQTSGTVNCTVGDLAVGAQAIIAITVVAPITTGTITNTAGASSTVSDTQPSNNTVSVTVQVK